MKPYSVVAPSAFLVDFLIPGIFEQFLQTRTFSSFGFIILGWGGIFTVVDKAVDFFVKFLDVEVFCVCRLVERKYRPHVVAMSSNVFAKGKGHSKQYDAEKSHGDIPLKFVLQFIDDKFAFRSGFVLVVDTIAVFVGF